MHDKATGDIFQLFCDILADLAQGTTAITAFLSGRQHVILSFQMIGQWLAAVLAFGRFAISLSGFALLCLSRDLDLCVFHQIKGQLIKALGFGAKPRLAMAMKFGLQLLILVGQRLHRSHQTLADGPQFGGVFRQGFKGVQHEAGYNPL